MTTMRVAALLIRLACRGLPGPEREVRYREWTAEVAAILADPGTRSRPGRKFRALLFAADHIRGARRLADRTRFPYPATSWRGLMFMGFPVCISSAAEFGTHWLPVAHPVRIVLCELAMVAGMAYQVIRERRHWLVETKDEFDHARMRRDTILTSWWLVQSIAVTNWLAVNPLLLLPAGLVWGLILRRSPVVRWIFGWPGLEHWQPGQGPPQSH